MAVKCNEDDDGASTCWRFSQLTPFSDASSTEESGSKESAVTDAKFERWLRRYRCSLSHLYETRDAFVSLTPQGSSAPALGSVDGQESPQDDLRPTCQAPRFPSPVVPAHWKNGFISPAGCSALHVVKVYVNEEPVKIAMPRAVVMGTSKEDEGCTMLLSSAACLDIPMKKRVSEFLLAESHKVGTKCF